MLKALICRFFSEHDYKVCTEPRAVFLECRRCGVRSRGWELMERRISRANSPLRLFLADSIESARTVNAEAAAELWATLVDGGELRLTFGPESRLP